MTKYTPELAAAWKTVKKPFPFTVDVVENTNCIAFLIYSSEIGKMNDGERLQVMEWLYEVERVVNSFGVDVAFEGVHGEPGPI